MRRKAVIVLSVADDRMYQVMRRVFGYDNERRISYASVAAMLKFPRNRTNMQKAFARLRAAGLIRVAAYDDDGPNGITVLRTGSARVTTATVVLGMRPGGGG